MTETDVNLLNRQQFSWSVRLPERAAEIEPKLMVIICLKQTFEFT